MFGGLKKMPYLCKTNNDKHLEIMVTHAEITRVLNNRNTKTLVQWLDTTIKFSNKYIGSPQFFHPTHSKRDREVIVELLMNYFEQIEKIDVNKNGSVWITLK